MPESETISQSHTENESPPNESTSVRINWRRLGPTGLLGLAWTSLPAICGFILLAKIAPVSNWLLTHDEMGIVFYIAIFIISAGLGFLPTYAQAILGGWVFGFTLGFPAALAGFTGASVIGYFITRFVSRDRIEKEIAEHAKARVVRDALIGHGFWRTLGTVALLRLPPNSPFALTNLAMAGAGVGVAPFLIGTAIGMAPRTAVAVFMAATAAATGSEDLQSFVKEGPGMMILIIGIVITIIVLLILGWVANKAIDRVLNTSSD